MISATEFKAVRNKTSINREKLVEATTSLVNYCRKNKWEGYDPYDALNSRLFSYTPFIKSRVCRIVFTQVMKRLPINIRPLLLIDKEQNAKAIALFLMAGIKLNKIKMLDRRDFISAMTERVTALRSPNISYWCWGYSFPWQTRTVLVPRGAPNLVCTTFVANALLDAFEETGEAKHLDMAVSAGEYFLDELYWTDGDAMTSFSYPLPTSRSRVHNANFLAAALLARIYNITDEKKFLGPALGAARYSAGRQRDDGSWNYGEITAQRWVDNFHTGYNLCALRSIGEYTGTKEFDGNIRRGFNFYRKNFFTKDGAPKYFHAKAYPFDIHSAAQSIITLLKLKDLDENNLDLAHSVFQWAMNEMRDKNGYFYYQVLPFLKNKISYMRWSQAWMLMASSMLLEYSGPVAYS